jgi:hypothetical protein
MDLQIIVMCTCSQYSTERFKKLEWVRKHDLLIKRYPNMKFYRVISNFHPKVNTGVPTIQVDCPDNWEHVSSKIILGIKQIYDLHPNLDFLVKVDPDVEFNPKTLLENIIKYKDHDYIGYVIGASFPTFTEGHIGKCQDNQYNSRIYIDPFCMCIGCLVIKSKKSVSVLANCNAPYPITERVQAVEDIYMSILLKSANIFPTMLLTTTEDKEQYIKNNVIGWHNQKHIDYPELNLF